MNLSSNQKRWQPPHAQSAWQWDEDRLRQWQLEQFNLQLSEILPQNRFYKEKLGGRSPRLKSLDELSELPFTEKHELVESAAQSSSHISRHHTFARQEYSRLHRTSGTTGSPLLIMDTACDWQWWIETWQHVLQAGGISQEDRVFLAFSFGPFIGFWSAHAACVRIGATVIPGGGLSSLARLDFLQQTQATVLCGTPSYVLHLAEVAAAEQIDLTELSVRTIVVAGEAGGSVPAVRAKIENSWHANVIDHSGATEIGPWGFGWPNQPGLHVIETSFIAELLPFRAEPACGMLDRQSNELAAPDRTLKTPSPSSIDLPQSPTSEAARSTELHELVLTSIGRYGAPVIRYRTGDIVRAERPEDGPCRFLWLPGGVLGRADSMVTIRGVNVFPSSIDAIVRGIDAICEYRITVQRQGQLDQLEMELEAPEHAAEELRKRLSTQLGLRIPVRLAAPNTLPRSEAKAKRWIDLR